VFKAPMGSWITDRVFRGTLLLETGAASASLLLRPAEELQVVTWMEKRKGNVFSHNRLKEWYSDSVYSRVPKATENNSTKTACTWYHLVPLFTLICKVTTICCTSSISTKPKRNQPLGPLGPQFPLHKLSREYYSIVPTLGRPAAEVGKIGDTLHTRLNLIMM
jgi:hypothetical protein